MEGFVREYILNHFLQNNLFSNNQFGFLKGRSTVLQLLNIMDEWTECLERGGQINVNTKECLTVSAKLNCNATAMTYTMLLLANLV